LGKIFKNMKKTVLAILLFTCATFAYAQSIVPRVGLTLSTVTMDSEDDEDLDIKSKLGFTIGAGFNIPVNDMFSVQPELNFIQKGFKIDESYTEEFNGESYSEDFKYLVTTNYIELPVFAKFTFGTDTKFFIIAGPSIGFGLGGKAKLDYSFSYTVDGVTESESGSVKGKVKFGDEPDDVDEGDIYIEKRVDVGLQAGIGVLIKDLIAVEARYGLGLSSLDSEEDVMNRGFQFSVAVPLSLSK
jgi:hypothetical protein